MVVKLGRLLTVFLRGWLLIEISDLIPIVLLERLLLLIELLYRRAQFDEHNNSVPH